MLFLSSVILGAFLGTAAANNLPQNPDFSQYDLYAACPMQTWVNLTASYVVNGSAYLFVNKATKMSAGRLNFNVSPGIMNNVTFYAHVHNSSCALGGGGHFKANLTTFSDSSDTNEYWFTFAASGDGSVVQTQFSMDNFDPNFAFNPNAQSIVIHYPNATKIACCDLKLFRRYATCKSGFTGLNLYTSSGGAGGLYVSTDMKVSAGYLNFSVTDLNSNGFLDNSTFAAHVHNGTCAQSGLYHWRYNTTLTDPTLFNTTFNEFWWTFPGVGSGNYVNRWSSVDANPNVTFDGLVKSIVVHAANGTKAACCDLSLENTAANYAQDLNFTSYNMIGYCPSGAFVNIAPATTAVNYSFDGSAFLWADPVNMQSRGVLKFQSTPVVDPTQSLQAHVHMTTCDVLGGLHWKYNTSISGTVESNEFWFYPQPTANQPAGGASATYWAQTTSTTVTLDKRPRSIVVHLNGTKIQCCNLEFVSKFAFAPPQAWTALDPRVSVFGDVAVYISDTQNTTAGDLNFQMQPGTSDATFFAAHVHNQNCSSGSGTHWKYMASNSTLESNEIWWTYNGTGDGTNTVSEFSLQMNNDMVSPYPTGFKSVVIHAPAAQGTTKLACVDLTLVPPPSLMTGTGSGTGSGPPPPPPGSGSGSGPPPGSGSGSGPPPGSGSGSGAPPAKKKGAMSASTGIIAKLFAIIMLITAI